MCSLQESSSDSVNPTLAWVDSVKSVTSQDFFTQSSQVMGHPAPVDSVKSQYDLHHGKLPITLLIARWMRLASDRRATRPLLADGRGSNLHVS